MSLEDVVEPMSGVSLHSFVTAVGTVCELSSLRRQQTASIRSERSESGASSGPFESLFKSDYVGDGEKYRVLERDNL